MPALASSTRSLQASTPATREIAPPWKPTVSTAPPVQTRPHSIRTVAMTTLP
ncbi:hypothetical protein [Streptomyces sp. NPDC001070]